MIIVLAVLWVAFKLYHHFVLVDLPRAIPDAWSASAIQGKGILKNVRFWPPVTSLHSTSLVLLYSDDRWIATTLVTDGRVLYFHCPGTAV